MKLNSKWVIELAFMFLMFLAGLCLTISLLKGQIKEEGMWFFYIFAIALMIVPIMCELYHIFYGNTYYEYFFIPMEKFKKRLCDNMLILENDNHAYTYTYKFKEINNLKKIKAIQYYNIKKKPVGWTLIPLTQL